MSSELRGKLCDWESGIKLQEALCIILGLSKGGTKVRASCALSEGSQA